MRLARRRVLVQELPAVEGLARVDVLCIDKTGTLTEGRLAVQRGRSLSAGAAPTSGPWRRRWRRSPRTTPRRTPRCAPSASGSPTRRPGWSATGRRCRSPPPASGAAIAFGDRGAWIVGAPDVLLHGRGGAGRGARQPCARSPRPATAWSCSRPPPALDGDALPGRRHARRRGRPAGTDRAATPRETLAYFARAGRAREGDLRRRPARRWARSPRTLGLAGRRGPGGRADACRRTPTALADVARDATPCSGG